MEESKLFKRIDHVEMTTRDLDATLKFYQEVFGFKIKERMKIPRPPLEEIVFLTLGDTMIEILYAKAAAPAASGWQAGFRSMALEVDNMDDAVAFLKSKGYEMSVKPMNLGGTSWRGEVKDPNGFSIELRQWL
jgi:glyoxylase I family protein